MITYTLKSSCTDGTVHLKFIEIATLLPPVDGKMADLQMNDVIFYGQSKNKWHH